MPLLPPVRRASPRSHPFDDFDCTNKHHDRWASKKSVDEEIAFCLDAAEALAVARMLFRIDDAGLRNPQRNA